MEIKTCSICRTEQPILNFDLQSKNGIKRDYRCKECVKKTKRDKRTALNDKKYFENIKEHGYYLKICKVHGGLEYSDIKLRIKQSTEPHSNPLWVELICMKCKKDNDKADYQNQERYLFRLNLPSLKCTACKVDLKIKYFSNAGIKAKYPICKICNCDHTKKSYKEKSLFWRYGLSNEDYDLMNDDQNGLCKICNKKNDTHDKLYVDHNHTTGETRSLLCRSCNSMIGFAKEDKDILQKAIEYLKSYD